MPRRQQARPQSAPAFVSCKVNVDTLSEIELLTRARSLLYRVKITKLSLYRMKPALADIVDKRAASYHSAVAGEKLTGLQVGPPSRPPSHTLARSRRPLALPSQMHSSEELIATLSVQLRETMIRLDTLHAPKMEAPLAPRPSRLALLKQLRADPTNTVDTG